MKMQQILLIIALSAFVLLPAAFARTYEPAINFFFIVHVEPMLPNGNYPLCYQNINLLADQLRNHPTHPKITLLMNGDFIEQALFEGDSAFFRDLELEDHELGAHAHSNIHVSSMQWAPVFNTHRYGRPTYDHEETRQIWGDCTEQLALLTPNIHSMCAAPFLCSTEAELALENGYEIVPGNRSEKCQDYCGHLNRHPMRCGTNDLYGHELEEDLNSPVVYLDHFAQIGNENAHGYDCRFPAMIEWVDDAYDDWLERESSDLDSLDYYVWTFGFLTHLQNLDTYYFDQIEQFIDYLEENYIGQYTPRGNLIGKFSTCWETAQEFYSWENSHPGWSSFNYIHPYPQSIKINEIMYSPQGLNTANEWLELFNPFPESIDLNGWRISGAFPSDCWQFTNGVIQPGEYLVVANNGQSFHDQYGFYPDFEAYGGTTAENLFLKGNLSFHDVWDAVILHDTSGNSACTELNWVDVYSWGQSWHAGFADTNITSEGHSIGRDANSTDTDLVVDWSPDGINADEPTPGGQNINPVYVNLSAIRPDGYSFSGNYPNPFNTKTAFNFSLPHACDISLSLYNVRGQIVRQVDYGRFTEGSHFLQLSLNGLSSGVYPYIFHLGDETISGKMLYMK